MKITSANGIMTKEVGIISGDLDLSVIDGALFAQYIGADEKYSIDIDHYKTSDLDEIIQISNDTSSAPTKRSEK